MVPYTKTSDLAKVGAVSAMLNTDSSCIISGDGLGMGSPVWNRVGKPYFDTETRARPSHRRKKDKVQ
jgi:hypothetical protein